MQVAENTLEAEMAEIGGNGHPSLPSREGASGSNPGMPDLMVSWPTRGHCAPASLHLSCVLHFHDSVEGVRHHVGGMSPSFDPFMEDANGRTTRGVNPVKAVR